MSIDIKHIYLLFTYRSRYEDQRHKVNYLNVYSNCGLWLKNIKKNLTHVRPDLLVIYVYKNNSSAEEKARKFVLTQHDLTYWRETLDYIARTFDYRTETIK